MQHFVKEIITHLAEAQVEFVIVGGMSAVLHGVPVVTLDLDLCYRRTPANIARLAKALAPLQPRLRGLPQELPFTFDERAIQLGTNFTLEVRNENLDLLGEMSAIGGYENIVGQTTEMEVAGFKVRVRALAQLIATKHAAGRPKDLAVLPLIKATAERQETKDTAVDEPPAGA